MPNNNAANPCPACDSTVDCNCVECPGAERNGTHEDCTRIADAIDVCETCHKCKMYAHCDCWTCTRCNTDYAEGNQCGTCGVCPRCCGCFTCTGCEQRFNNGKCATCNQCRNCCICHAGERVNFFNQTVPAFHEAQRGQFKLNPSKRAIAAEIEVCKVSGTKDYTSGVVKRWKGAIVKDGSLPPETGFEINTAPASGDLFVNQIQEICEALKKQNAYVGPEAGLHVHVDARDFSPNDLRKLILLWSKLEDGFFKIVKPDRRGSRYCIPCAESYVTNMGKIMSTKQSKDAITTKLYGDKKNLNRERNHKYSAKRYNALNLHSFFMRQSIENRMHHGTADFDDIVKWGILNAKMLDFAFDNSEDDIMALNGAPLDNLIVIADNDEMAKWIEKRAKQMR